MQASIYSNGSPLPEVSPLGFWRCAGASPAFSAQVSSLFGLQRFCSKRYKLLFLQHCVASLAQCFFLGRARLQGWAPPFGLRV
jgi:hypothetical protein